MSHTLPKKCNATLLFWKWIQMTIIYVSLRACEGWQKVRKRYDELIMYKYNMYGRRQHEPPGKMLKRSKEWGKGILVLPQTKRNSTEKQILRFCRFSMKMPKFRRVLSPDKNFHSYLLDEKGLLMCWEPKNIYIYTIIVNLWSAMVKVRE